MDLVRLLTLGLVRGSLTDGSRHGNKITRKGVKDE